MSNGQLFGDGDGDRLRLQPLERPRGHALAGRSDRGPASARFLFLRDVATGEWWSATAEPKTRRRRDVRRRIFSDDKASFIKTVGTLRSEVECIVVSEGNGEGRRITHHQ